jgi:hypothetical protein
MPNRIGKLFKAQDMDTASTKITAYVTALWDLRIRRAIVASSWIRRPGRAVETLRRRS